MFTLRALAGALSLGLVVGLGAACKGKAPPPAPSATAAARASAAAPSASASQKPSSVAPPSIPVSDEMRDFVAMVAEDHKLSEALTKFGAPSLNDHGMGNDPLDAPKVVGTEPSSGDCYILAGSDGPAIHEYLICWSDKQIVQASDRGMR
jgi:hypothetical protein